MTSLAQAKLLVDPFRLRLLQAFVEKPKTTKQVADELGEKAPRLYRHVAALERAGFLEPKGERRKRGTVERYLQAVATRFHVPPSLFAGPGAKAQEPEGAQMVRKLFRQTEAELALSYEGMGTAPVAPVIMGIRGKGTRAQIHELRRKLLNWLDECEHADAPAENEAMAYGGLVVFYPISEPGR